MRREIIMDKYFKRNRQIIDKELNNILPKKTARPRSIHEAMRYYTFTGGKRIRPILLLESSKVCGKSAKDAILLSCAIELIHSYSLIHDDLPSMDDAAMRRGKPSCHVKYGEANAILAGDALLSLAFNVISRIKDRSKIGEIMFEISRAIGTFGMIGGQAIELDTKSKSEPNLPAVEYISILKTGSLIKVSCKAGAIIGGAHKSEAEALEAYGERVGLVFQIIDDILDGDGYAKVMGAGAAREEAESLTDSAKNLLDIFGKKADNLKRIADFVLSRKK